MDELLHRLANATKELHAIAAALGIEARLLQTEIPSDLNETPPFLGREADGEPLWGMLASQCYRERRVRDRIFDDATLFGEPAWDILLDLMSAEMTETRLSVSSACIGANVPPTTALRWLAILEERGLVTRENDASDRRRAFVRITPEGVRKMKSYFTEIR